MDAIAARRLTVTGANGIRLAGNRCGEGYPVVLLHGAGQTRHAWRKTAHRLVAAGFEVRAFDHRGHGHSEWATDGDYGIDAIASDVRAMAASCSVPPIVIGASLGGYAALIAEGETPGVAAALVLVDIALRPAQDGIDRIIDFMRARPDGFASVEDARDEVIRFLPHRQHRGDTSGLARNLRKGTDNRLRWHWDPRLLDSAPHVDPSGRIERCVHAARQLSLPTLLVRGGKSDVVSAEAAHEFIEIVPHAELVDVSGAAHMVAGDDNDSFTEAVVGFVSRLKAQGHIRTITTNDAFG